MSRQLSPEEQYRRLRDPDRWVGIAAPNPPATRRTSTAVQPSVGLVALRITVAAVVVAIAAAVVASSVSRGAPPAAPQRTPIGSILRSVSLPGDLLSTRVVTAASDSALYVAAPASGSPAEDHWYLSRVDASNGRITTVKWASAFPFSLAVGPDGLYSATSSTPQDATGGTLPRDQIVRYDERTLRVLTAEMLPTGAPHASRTTFVAGGAVLGEVDDGGSARLLDPSTLAEQEHAQVLTQAQVQAGGQVQHPVLLDPGSDGGRMWVFAGGRLVALDLGALRTLVSVPQQGYRFVIPTPSGLLVLGDRVGRLADDGTITPAPSTGLVDAEHPVTAAAGTDGGVLEQVGGGPAPTVLLQTGDAPPSRGLTLTASGALLAGAGQYGWVVGVPGQGGEVSEVRIATAVASPTADPPSATAVTAQNVRSLRVGIDIAPVPAGTRPVSSAEQAFATCGGGAVCGKGVPEHFLLALVSTRAGLFDRLAYVMQWTGEYCMPTGPVAAPPTTTAPAHETPCNLVAVVDATTGSPLFSQSGPG